MKHTISYGPEDFHRDTAVSRETLERLKIYAETLVSWNKKVNLVGRSTIDDLWQRHFLDSAQLYPLFSPNSQTLLDLGSGAGFPGLVLAIMGCPQVYLVESDRKKAAFLREAARVTGTPVHILSVRIEALDPFPVDVVTARALAPLTDLLEWVEPFLGPKSACLFLKGRNVEDELTDLRKMWETEIVRQPSRTDSESTVVCMRGVRRVRSNQT